MAITQPGPSGSADVRACKCELSLSKWGTRGERQPCVPSGLPSLLASGSASFSTVHLFGTEMRKSMSSLFFLKMLYFSQPTNDTSSNVVVRRAKDMKKGQKKIFEAKVKFLCGKRTSREGVKQCFVAINLKEVLTFKKPGELLPFGREVCVYVEGRLPQNCCPSKRAKEDIPY